MLKRVLSSEALKASKDTKSQDFRSHHKGSVSDLSPSNPKMPHDQHISLLQQLVSEQESKFMAQVEEVCTLQPSPNPPFRILRSRATKLPIGRNYPRLNAVPVM